jgi:hypothetical protein
MPRHGLGLNELLAGAKYMAKHSLVLRMFCKWRMLKIRVANQQIFLLPGMPTGLTAYPYCNFSIDWLTSWRAIKIAGTAVRARCSCVNSIVVWRMGWLRRCGHGASNFLEYIC